MVLPMFARHGLRRIAACGACAATASVGMVTLPSQDPVQIRYPRCCISTPSLEWFPSKAVLCESKVQGLGHVHFENERLRVTELRLQASKSESVSFQYPHLRWQVLPASETKTPMPTFHSAGQAHTIRAGVCAEYREYVFEFLGPPKYTEQEYRERQAAAWYHGSPGTRFMFENEYCAVYDFRVPAKGGDKHDMHQHIVDHFFVMLDLPCSLEVYVPESQTDLPAGDRRVHNVRLVGRLECPDGPSSWRYYGEIGHGGFVDGKPKLGPAVHGICNPGSQEFREYYIDLK